LILGSRSSHHLAVTLRRRDELTGTGREEHPMNRKARWFGGSALAVALIGGGTAAAISSASGDDQPLAGPATEKAIAAALQNTGGGTVIETEAGDDGTAYGVEIRLDDGRVVEIGLDANFKVIGQESDDDASADANAPPPNDLALRFIGCSSRPVPVSSSRLRRVTARW
ncbi:MAG TPA: hypothetical protein VNA32_00995, partial [Actinomycetota bacterium]|nr:hypothetical protein [Actinomycetota bacterium]